MGVNSFMPLRGQIRGAVSTRWLEANPGQVKLDLADEAQLSMGEAAKVLGLSNARRFRAWLNVRNRGGIGALQKVDGKYYISGAALKRAIATDRRDGPVLHRSNGVRQTLGDTLIVMFLWDWSDNRTPNRYITIPFSLQKLSDFLKSRGVNPSVFERYNYLNEEGKPYRFRSHDFRRLLNTVALIC